MKFRKIKTNETFISRGRLHEAAFFTHFNQNIIDIYFICLIKIIHLDFLKAKNQAEKDTAMKSTLDQNDKKLVAALTIDGQQSPGKVADEIGVTAPTVRSRMKNLIAAGALRVAGMVNPMKAKGLTVALVGISLHSHEQLDEKLDQIGSLPRVNWCAVVTGRYDIIVEIVCSADIGDLYDFLDKDLSQVGDISSSESFVVMKSRRKWLCLPDAVVEEFQS